MYLATFHPPVSHCLELISLRPLPGGDVTSTMINGKFIPSREGPQDVALEESIKGVGWKSVYNIL